MEIPGFRILEKIGESSKAITWKAHQVALDRLVAVRVLRPELAAETHNIRDFIDPARIAARIKHPNLLQIYDVCEEADRQYVVQEYIDGKSVGQRVAEGGPLPVRQALDIATHVAEALKLAWEKANLVHRNIKPDNIMIDEDGNTKIADIGLARVMAPDKFSAHAESDEIEGTPNYMSPEQIEGKRRLTCRSDMYSLGASLYHILTGQAPFDGLPPEEVLRRHLSGELEHPRVHVPDLPNGVSDLLRRLMMKEPQARPKDWAEVLEEIRKAAAGRIVVRRNDAPAGPSTIAAEPPPGKGGKRGGKRSPGAGPPPLLKAALWLLWFGFLGVMGYGRYQQAVYRAAGTTGTASAEAHAGTPSPDVAGLGDAPWWNALYTKLTQPDPPDLPPPAPEPTVAETAMPEPAVPAPEDPPPPLAATQEPPAAPDPLQTGLARIAQLVLQSDPRSAQAELDRLPPGPTPDRTVLADMLAEAARVDQLVTDGFINRVGMEIPFTIGTNSFVMIPRALSGDRANVLIIRGTPGRGVTNSSSFSLAALRPSEKLRWIEEAATPSRRLVQCMLHAAAGDTETARRAAERCGPLAPYLAHELAAR